MSINPLDIITFFQNFNIDKAFKVVLLIFIGFYAIFAFMLYNKLRSLDKIIFFPSNAAEAAIKVFGLLYLLIVLSLFVATLVIV